MTRAGVLAGVAAVLLLLATAFSWQEETPSVRAATSSRPVLDGPALFRAKGCATCHTGPDTEPAFTGLPDLSDAASWADGREPGRSAAAYLRESIREPGVFIAPDFHAAGGPITGMPTLAVSDTEVDALVAYLLAR